ncbi:hypothetical protein D0Q02_28495 [Micromonospora craniellae]|uniref:Uncharacterized protein n=1 Tax=Micromonospora craniellae TaxID=2294034 RepID=A0A372FRK5_9ACTN|nr:hypothetical protein D0Q02_28495 [Micromonospora craniellae]
MPPSGLGGGIVVSVGILKTGTTPWSVIWTSAMRVSMAALRSLVVPLAMIVVRCSRIRVMVAGGGGAGGAARSTSSSAWRVWS